MWYYLQSVVLGTVQGITEFLPVSSTAHLIVLQKLFRLDAERYGLTFDMFTNLGTALALLIFFREDVVGMARHLRWPFPWRLLTADEKLPWHIIGATVLPAALGVVLEPWIASTFRSLWVIVVSLVVVAILMMAVERRESSKGKPITGAMWFVIGAAQAIAFLPGVSRSGITICTAMLLGLRRPEAARASFLLSLPITLGASLKEVVPFVADLSGNPQPISVLWFYAIGTVSAGVVGYLSIKYLLKYLQQHSLSVFSYYRMALAAVLAVFFIR